MLKIYFVNFENLEILQSFRAQKFSQSSKFCKFKFKKFLRRELPGLSDSGRSETFEMQLRNLQFSKF